MAVVTVQGTVQLHILPHGQSTGLILDYSLVQVTETGISVAMEKEGLQRCINYVLDELNLHIATLAVVYVFK